MLPKRGRKKKLVVALHFQLSSQAGWKCDDCRKAGLERKRRCGFLEGPPPDKSIPVWAHLGTVSLECPKSYVTSQSLAWIDEFAVWRRHARDSYAETEAKKLDAFLTLEAHIAAENKQHRE